MNLLHTFLFLCTRALSLPGLLHSNFHCIKLLHSLISLGTHSQQSHSHTTFSSATDTSRTRYCFEINTAVKKQASTMVLPLSLQHFASDVYSKSARSSVILVSPKSVGNFFFGYRCRIGSCQLRSLSPAHGLQTLFHNRKRWPAFS